MKKGFIVGLAAGLTVAGASLVFANSQIQAILNNQIKVTLNGQVQEFKDETTNETQYPITYHDRTYLPLRTVANLVGVDVDYDASSNTAMLNDINEDNIEQVYQKYIENRKNALLNEKRTYKEVYNILEYNEDENEDIQFYLHDNGDLTMTGMHNIFTQKYGNSEYKIASNIVKIGLLQPNLMEGFPGIIWYIDSNGQFSYIHMDDLINSDKGKYTIKTSEKLKYIINIEEVIYNIDSVAFLAIDILGNEIPLY